MTSLAHIADLVVNRPLCLLPAKLAIINNVLAGRLGLAALAETYDDGLTDAAKSFLSGNLQASRFVGSNMSGSKQLPYNLTAEGVAVISVVGSLVNRGSWIGASSGMVSYEGLVAQLSSALTDQAVKAVLLDIESPGGQVTGMLEAAETVRRVRAKKPIVASINGMACSAAYCIAAAAAPLIITPSGATGSIGVVMLHADYSRALEREGIGITLLHAGAHKIDGNPYSPLAPSTKAEIQNEIDAVYHSFLSSVAMSRPALTVDAAARTEARVYIGEQAVAEGLADHVGTFDEALAVATRFASGSSLSAAASPLASRACGVLQTAYSAPRSADLAASFPPPRDTLNLKEIYEGRRNGLGSAVFAQPALQALARNENIDPLAIYSMRKAACFRARSPSGEISNRKTTAVAEPVAADSIYSARRANLKRLSDPQSKA